jgi:hypothetical protein
VAELRTYRFPTRTGSGVLLGMSPPQLGGVATAGVVFVAAVSVATPAAFAVGAAAVAVLLAGSFVPVAGRPAVAWVPVAVLFGWAMATRNNEFYASPDLSVDLPDGVLDVPGELFGIEIATLDEAGAGYAMVRDTFRNRVVAVAEVSGADFLFLDPADEQARVEGWGAVLDQLAQSMPEVTRLQVVHTVGPASPDPLVRHHAMHGGRGTEATAASYGEVLELAGRSGQDHRCLVAVAVDLAAARRAVRQAGGGNLGACRVLMDRAATIEDALTAAGLDVHGWLTAGRVAELLRVGFDPAARGRTRPDDDAVSWVGPSGIVDGWSAVRHESGWSTTVQVAGPPSRPVTGDFLQYLLIGVPAERRMSLLYVPTPMRTAERRAQTQQATADAEQAVRARWGFGTSARQRREQSDAVQREAEVVEGRAVFRLVWLVTVTGRDPHELDAAVGQLDAAARRCGLDLRPMTGTQRQAAAFTLPLCRGAR